jgi:hypothetical protein
MRKIVMISLLTGILIWAADASPIRFGSYTYDGSGLPGGDLGAALVNSGNFASFGYTSAVDAGEVAFGGITAGYLNGVDIFFTDRNGISSSPSPGDVANLVSWVNAGGVLIINNDRSTSFTSLDPLLNAFGMDLVSAPTDAIEALTIEDGAHPIMNGPFGVVSSMGLRDASRYTSLSPDVDMIASWQNGDGAIAVLGPGGARQGAVIALPDVERFLLGFNSSLGTGDTEIATLNAVAYGVSVIPEPASMALIGLFTTGIWFKRRFFAA